MEIPIDQDCASFHLSPVLDGCTVDISVFFPEQSLDSSSIEFFVVTGLVMEENNVSDLGNLALFLPGYCETVSGVLLSPEGVEEGQGNLPLGELILN